MLYGEKLLFPSMVRISGVRFQKKVPRYEGSEHWGVISCFKDESNVTGEVLK